MIVINHSDIVQCLRKVGVAEGQTIYVYSDLCVPGMIKGMRSKEAFCQTYLDALFEVLTMSGTVVVPTFTTQVARFDMDFILEETPSLTGLFSEYIRCHPDSLRSVHPLNSVCAIGKEKEYICSNNGLSDFGWDSPFQRMHQKNAKIISIGLESGYVVGIAHYLEVQCGLPYVYNKLLKWIPIVNGSSVNKMYFSSRRYLDIVAGGYDLTKFVKHMREIGEIVSVRLGGGWVHLADFEKVFLEGTKMLREDPYFLLKKVPEFIYGKLPFDGPTGEREDLDCKNATEPTSFNWDGYYLLNKYYAGGDDHELE